MAPLKQTYVRLRRQPAALVSLGSQHCATMVAPCAVVVLGSKMHVEAGKPPAPPSNALRGTQAVGDAVGEVHNVRMVGKGTSQECLYRHNRN